MPNIKTAVTREEVKRRILPIVKRYGIRKVGLFGSCARGEMKKNSDIDLLVDIKKDLSLLDFVGIKLELEDALGKKVDLVEYRNLKPLLRERILKEEMRII